MLLAAAPAADKAADKTVGKTVDKAADKAVNKAIDKAAKKPPEKIRTANVVYVPTPNNVVEKMLEWAEVKKDDVLYDLGSGNGRIVVTAAKKFGCKAIGYEIDPDRIDEGPHNIKKRDVGRPGEDRASGRVHARPDAGQRHHDVPAARDGEEAAAATAKAQGRLADRGPRLPNPGHQGRQGNGDDFQGRQRAASRLSVHAAAEGREVKRPITGSHARPWRGHDSSFFELSERRDAVTGGRGVSRRDAQFALFHNALSPSRRSRPFAPIFKADCTMMRAFLNGT